jgi:hypothetical protein
MNLLKKTVTNTKTGYVQKHLWFDDGGENF